MPGETALYVKYWLGQLVLTVLGVCVLTLEPTWPQNKKLETIILEKLLKLVRYT